MKIFKIIVGVLLVLFTIFVLLTIFLPEVDTQNAIETKKIIKTAKQKIETKGYNYFVDYDSSKWNLYTYSGDSLGNYGSIIKLTSKKTYTDYESTDLHVYPVYEITFHYFESQTADLAPKPGDPDFTGYVDEVPKPQPFKKDDFILVNTIKGKKLYIVKSGNIKKIKINGIRTFVSKERKVPFSEVVLQEYNENKASEYMDIFSTYNDVFTRKEEFTIDYSINSKEGSWEELKPELIEIVKSFRFEKIKKTE